MKKNLLKIYKKFRDSDILEDCDSGIVLAFLYYIKKGNLEGKSFNEDYHANTEKDPLKERLKELKVLYKEFGERIWKTINCWQCECLRMFIHLRI